MELPPQPPRLPRNCMIQELQATKNQFPEKDFGDRDDPWLTNPYAGFWPDLVQWIQDHPNIQPVALVESREQWRRRVLRRAFTADEVAEGAFSFRAHRMYFEDTGQVATTDGRFNHNNYTGGARFLVDPTRDDPSRFWYDCYLDTNQGSAVDSDEESDDSNSVSDTSQDDPSEEGVASDDSGDMGETIGSRVRRRHEQRHAPIVLSSDEE